MKSREGCCGHGVQKVCDYHAGYDDGVAITMESVEGQRMIVMGQAKVLREMTDELEQSEAQRDALVDAIIGFTNDVENIGHDNWKGRVDSHRKRLLAALAALDKPKVD